MNHYEAAGRWRKASQERQTLLLRIRVMARSLSRAGRLLEHYAPPYPGRDDAPDALDETQAVLPDIEQAMQAADCLLKDMQALEAEFGEQVRS